MSNVTLISEHHSDFDVFLFFSKLPREQGSILYCTTGVLLRWLVDDP